MHQKPGGKNYCFIKYILSHCYHFSLLLFSEIWGEKIGIIPVFKFPWLLVSTCLTFSLPWVTKSEFLLTISIQYQADKWSEYRKISVLEL